MKAYEKDTFTSLFTSTFLTNTIQDNPWSVKKQSLANELNLLGIIFIELLF